MRNVLTSCFFLAAFACVAVFVGCSRPPVRNKEVKVDGPKDDPILRFIESVRYSENTRAGEDWTRYRVGLDQLASHFAKPEFVKPMQAYSLENRKFWEAEVHLAEDEHAEVESTSFRTADAHYLDECFLLRDAARFLEITESDKIKQAQHLFGWVMRNVLLHEQVDTWVPPAFALRRGYGGPVERAMVFLALLRQAQIEGCLIVAPDTEPLQVLAGVLDPDPKNPSVRLFDPRLGLPLMNKDGSAVLSVKEAVTEPALLKPAQMEQAKKLEAWLVCPLYVLSPRMLELQKQLSRHDAIVLHLNAAELARETTRATGFEKAKVWNHASKGNSPTRCLRQFLPKQEGGTDESNRAAAVTIARVPMDNILANLAQIDFTAQLLPKSAFNMMLGLNMDLLTKYELQPREMYLRGLYDPMARRFERLQVFTNEAQVGGLQDKKFRDERHEWIAQMKLADALSGDDKAQVRAKGQQDMQRLWGQDQFISYLVEIGKEEKLDPKHVKTVLTRVLAVGMRDHFDFSLARAQANVHHEKAVYAQALLPRKPTDEARKDARNAWLLARTSWANFYVDRVALAGLIKQRLQQMAPEQPIKQIGMLESLHLDVQHYFNAKMRLAECKAHLDGADAATAYRKEIQREIEAIEKAGLLHERIRELRGGVERTPYAKAALSRLDLLAHDWSEQGSYAWLKRQCDHAAK